MPNATPQPASPHAIFTCAFKGFESNSLWLTPLSAGEDSLSPQFFAGVVEARERARALLFAGCELAKARHPELAQPLAALQKAEPDLDFFELPERQGILGWCRMTLDAPGASIEALRACEAELAATRAPLLVAEAAPSERLGAFACAANDDVPSAFVTSLHEATVNVAQAYLSQPQKLAPAEAVVLESSDGSKRLVAMMASAEHAKEGLAELATFAKFAQACIEAKHACAKIAGAEDFFAPMIAAMGGGKGEMSKRVALELPKASFFPTPTSIHMTKIAGLPTESFDACARSFLEGLSRRFGSIAGSSKGLAGDPSALDIAQLAELSPMFGRLPEPKASATAPQQQPAPPGP